MQNPGTGVVSHKSNGNIIVGLANANNISLNGVDVVVSGAAGAADDVEGVLRKASGSSTKTIKTKTHAVQMHRMLN